MRIHFHELTNLSPTVGSTVLKLVEEIGELSREVQKYRHGSDNLQDLLGELLDVSQTTATLTFVLEREGKTHLADAVASHIAKLQSKGYMDKDAMCDAGVSVEGGRLSLSLPELSIEPGLTDTFLKISEEAGELVQVIGKRSGMSGETRDILDDESRGRELSLALLDVAQCCVTLLCIMAKRNNLNVEGLLQKHEEKLREHGYI